MKTILKHFSLKKLSITSPVVVSLLVFLTAFAILSYQFFLVITQPGKTAEIFLQKPSSKGKSVSIKTCQNNDDLCPKGCLPENDRDCLIQKYKAKSKECAQGFNERYETCMGNDKERYEECLYQRNYETCGELFRKNQQCTTKSLDRDCLGKLNETWSEINPYSLPRFELEDERERQRQEDILRRELSAEPSLLPSKPIRQPAEFEPVSGVLIRYPFGIPKSIIGLMSKNTKVVTIVKDVNERDKVRKEYRQSGIVTNVEFLVAPTETYWTRDYGPWFIHESEGEFSVIDAIYTKSKPFDDEIPIKFATSAGLDFYRLGLVHRGGNYMTDGLGVAISTDLLIDHNLISEDLELTIRQIKQKANIFLGIETYHIVPDVTGEYIRHIDTWAKFLAPDKIMIRQVPRSHSQYDEIEKAVRYFKKQTSSYGTPYKIFRVPTPNDEPYTNSLILNDKVFVPLMRSKSDNDALKSYKEAMPGYEVIGVSDPVVTPSWLSTDALHCRVLGIPDKEMLYIKHIPIKEGQYIEAEIIPYSRANLREDSINLLWSLDGKKWGSVRMTKIESGRYSTCLPHQSNGSEVLYYLHAEDESGRSESHPYIGAPGAHSFIVGDEPLANDKDFDGIEDLCDTSP